MEGFMFNLEICRKLTKKMGIRGGKSGKSRQDLNLSGSLSGQYFGCFQTKQRSFFSKHFELLFVYTKGKRPQVCLFPKAMNNTSYRHMNQAKSIQTNIHRQILHKWQNLRLETCGTKKVSIVLPRI
jgi:hypothetical protein